MYCFIILVSEGTFSASKAIDHATSVLALWKFLGNLTKLPISDIIAIFIYYRTLQMTPSLSAKITLLKTL